MVEEKSFESPSSLTEDTDDKSLSERGFKLSYKDLDIKTDEATSMTDSATEEQSATESATESSTMEASESVEKAATSKQA